jgi:DNA-binding helix-hairpin-helix protein with protein kinase domain
MPRELRTERNGTIRLDQPLTRPGGEGQVFTIAGSSSVVAKLYHQPPSATKVDKLRFQVRNANPALESICAWPTDLLLDPRNPRVVQGILMRKMRGKEIHKLYGPTDRHNEFPTAAWDFLVHVAMNSAIAFETLHQNGAVMADVNEGNLLVQDGDGRVSLIDCDSYQVQNGHTSYLCDVGIPMWTPPELQGINFHGLNRTANHDRFGLAVIIFRLLFMGRHPFAGVPTGKEQFEMQEAIKRYLFAFSPHAWPRGIKPPPASLPLDAIPDRLRKLFERAFLPGSERPNTRPTGSEWAAELKSLGAAMKRKACIDPGHTYWHGLTSCPWCDIQNKGGPNFFIAVSINLNTGGATIDITAFWATIQRVVNSHLMNSRVSVPTVGAVMPHRMPMPRPVPSRLACPVAPERDAPLPAPVLAPPPLPTKPVKATFPRLELPPMHPSERIWRVCLLSGLCLGVGSWFCVTINLLPVAMGTLWGAIICLFYALIKGSTAVRERKRRLTAIAEMRSAAARQIEDEYAQKQQRYETEIKEILSQHAAFVARAEAGYQRECQRLAAEFESKMNTYQVQLRLYENEKARFEAELALWNAERDRRLQRRDTTNQDLAVARDQLQALLATFRQKVNAELPKLDAARQQFEKARADEIAAFRELNNRRRDVQLRQHLQAQSIQAASIPKIGDAKKATLTAYGFGSAWDIHPNMDVPGIGDVLKGNLLAWRADCEQRFRYNPNAPLPPAEVRAVKIKFSGARQTAMVVVREGAAKLEALESDIRSRQSQLQLNLIEAARKHAQAAADFAECA